MTAVRHRLRPSPAAVQDLEVLGVREVYCNDAAGCVYCNDAAVLVQWEYIVSVGMNAEERGG